MLCQNVVALVLPLSWNEKEHKYALLKDTSILSVPVYFNYIENSDSSYFFTYRPSYESAAALSHLHYVYLLVGKPIY